MTYNVFGARHRSALRQVIQTVSPDVLVVNETPKVPLIWRWQCDRLARSWGLRRAAGGRDAGSNMICVSSRVDIEWTTARRLHQPRFKPRRGVVAVQCAVEGAPFGVVGVHLSLLGWSRPTEAAAAVADAEPLKGPLLLCGDFNERPDGPCWQAFLDIDLVDYAHPEAFTSQAATPHQRIDGLLVRGAQALEHAVPAFPSELLVAASDHLPIVATVDLG
jgi:endonuclease/exonuclease/phosphatase family metal-dependent hydrolase